jgi:hypothetical protein
LLLNALALTRRIETEICHQVPTASQSIFCVEKFNGRLNGATMDAVAGKRVLGVHV